MSYKTLPNFLSKVPVSLQFRTGVAATGNFVSVPMFVDAIEIRQDWQRQYQYGNPKDWISAYWQGGEVSFSGILFNTANLNMLYEHYVDAIRIGTSYTLRICRRKNLQLSTQQLAQNMSYLTESLVYRFDAYKVGV